MLGSDLRHQLVQETAEAHRAPAADSLENAFDGHRPVADLKIENVAEEHHATDRSVLAREVKEFFEVRGVMKERTWVAEVHVREDDGFTAHRLAWSGCPGAF